MQCVMNLEMELTEVIDRPKPGDGDDATAEI